jgi:hypothetical protein
MKMRILKIFNVYLFAFIIMPDPVACDPTYL